MLKLSRVALSASLVSLLLLSGCGGGSPTEASGSAGGATMIGMVLGASAASGAGVSSASAAAAGTITVTVQEQPAITTTVGSDGSFTLRGLPEGDFTLVFTDASGVLGTLHFSQVKPNQEITVTVDVSGGGVRLVDERRNGIGHGGLEIEARVDAVVSATEAADSTFEIGGYTVIARPGVTAIREGNRRRTVFDVTGGRRVHVKGEWLPPAGGGQPVLAHEIKLQGGDDAEDGDGGANQKITICHKGKNTISVALDAWPAHQAHGDTMGACR